MSYKAIVARIKVRPIEGCNNIQAGNCLNTQVVVGLDTKDNQLGVLFLSDGQLSEQFCEANNLVRKKDPLTGESSGGYLEANRRVRAIKLRNTKSEGLFCPLSYFTFTGCDVSSLKEGDEFTELNGVPICNKYMTPATIRAAKNAREHGVKKKKSEILKKMMVEHRDTAQLKHYIKNIPVGALLICSIKQHGTSMRYGNIQDEVDIPYVSSAFRFLSRFLKIKIPQKRIWTHRNGSRRVILEARDALANPFYGDQETFRTKITDGIVLHKSEILFGEIVGYLPNGKPLMQTQNIKDACTKKNLKENIAKFGEQVVYKYGCLPGTCDLYVYRIAHVNEDGVEVDLPWGRVVGRCKELGLKTVKVLEEDGIFIYDGDGDKLLNRIELLVNGESGYDIKPDPHDNSHPLEGIVVRVEHENGVDFYKHKSFAFLVMESVKKMIDEEVDIEEAA